MSEFFLDIVNMSISASWLVLAVLALRLILKKAPKWVNVLLWGIVAIRLICPFSIESALSLIPSTQTISPEIMMDWSPEISTGIEPLDRVVNPVITSSFAPEPSASANPLQILIPVAANLWLLGVLVMLLYTAFSYFNLRRKLSTAVVLRNNIFQCETVHSPFVLGIFRPKIYLPYTIDGENLHHVVAHEQAHIRRKDHWWKPLGFLLLTVYWFNPLMWVAYILLCRDIELACDEKVIAELGNDQRAEYTQALVACSVNRCMIAACPLAFGEVGVKERVNSIMNYRKPAFWIVLLAVVACVTVAVCFLTNPVGFQFDEANNTIVSANHFDMRTADDAVAVEMNPSQISELSSRLAGVRNAKSSDQYAGLTPGYQISALLQDGTYIRISGYSLSVNNMVDIEWNADRYVVSDSDFQDYLSGICSGDDTASAVNNGNAVAGKTYVYENEGIMGNFTITLYDDKTFSYYEGMASSYFGVGNWQLDGSIVTLSDDDQLGYPLTNKFRMDDDDLVFVEQGSSNFVYVELKEGERFHCTGEAFKNTDSAISPEQSTYTFKATIPEIQDQLQHIQALQSAQENSVTEPSESTYEIYNIAPLEDLPDTYTLEEATIDKCVMMFDGEIRDNADVWNTFLEEIESGQSATVRIVHYYHETDNSPSAMYIYDLTYDGETYELRWYEDGKEHIAYYQHLRYFYGKSENEDADYDAYISYILTDDRYATRKELLLSYASSAHDAAIPHFEVYADYIDYPDHPDIPSELFKAELIPWDNQDMSKLQKQVIMRKTLEQLQKLLANAQALDYEPKTYGIYGSLILAGIDGSTVILGLDTENDLFVLDDIFYDYGPGYDENGNVDAT